MNTMGWWIIGLYGVASICNSIGVFICLRRTA